MVKQYIPISLLAAGVLLGTQAIAQDQFSRDFESVRQELRSWDPVRGEWLSSSLVAMTKNQPIPDRMFPEDLTPVEMMRLVPASTRNAITETAQNNAGSNNRDSISRQSWNQVASVMGRTNCKPVMGRTYGDPHLSSFDGASYSFQTVGEFILAKSRSGNFEVQVRQRNQTDDFSLNTAAAMNVAGDRLCFYAQEKPDGNNTTPIRLEGDAIYVDDDTYFLPHGGTIHRSSRNNYLVTWPTGETVLIDIHAGAFSFMNITAQIYPCADTYEGILGNANGRSSDDFEIRGGAMRPASLVFHPFGNNSSDAAEKEYLAWMARDFARSWRIDQPTSLFDYGFGQNTFTFTDESFPRVHHTLADMPQSDRDRARRECERQGVLAADMNGCIYDVGFVNVPPTPRPNIPSRTDDLVVQPVMNPKPNVNPGNPPRRPSLGAEAPDKTEDSLPPTGGGGAHPIDKNPNVGAVNTDPGKQTTAEKPATSGVSDTKAPAEPQVSKPSPAVEKPVAEQPKKPAPAVVEEEEEEKPRIIRWIENSGSSSSESSSGSSGSGGSGSGSTWGSGNSGSSSSGSSGKTWGNSGSSGSESGSTPVSKPSTSTPAPAVTKPSTPASSPSRSVGRP